MYYILNLLDFLLLNSYHSKGKEILEETQKIEKSWQTKPVVSDSCITRRLMKIKILKITYLVFLFLSLSLKASAPVTKQLTIISTDPVEPYKNLISAIGRVETMHDTLAYNPVEQAVGYFQIRPIRLEDYNKRTGSKIKMKQLFDYKTSEKIFLYYAELAGPYNFEKIAKNWNGSGPRTHYYWKRVKKYL